MSTNGFRAAVTLYVVAFVVVVLAAMHCARGIAPGEVP